MSFLRKVLSGYMPKSGIAGSYGSSMYRFLRYLHTDLHSGCTSLFFPPTVEKGSLFSTSPPAFVICGLINDGHSDWCEVVAHVVLICISLIICLVNYDGTHNVRKKNVYMYV